MINVDAGQRNLGGPFLRIALRIKLGWCTTEDLKNRCCDADERGKLKGNLRKMQQLGLIERDPKGRYSLTEKCKEQMAA